MTIRLTAKGVRLLRHASQLGVAAEAVFNAPAGDTIFATKSFTLHR